MLNPYDTSIADTNVGSLVLSLRYGEISFLFTGDATIEAEQELIYRRLVPDATVLKVAHHGSGGSTGGAFLTVSRPEFAVVQVGQNVYGHPKAGVIAALEAICLNGGVYRTDTSGTIIFVTDGRSLWLKE